MVVCPYCRWSNPEQTAVCLHCGAVLPSASPPPYAAPPPPAGYQAAPPLYAQPYFSYGGYGVGDSPASRQLAVGQLVWSIINLVLCCMPLGIAGLVMTLNAKNCMSMEEEQQKLKTAKTLNLIGTIGGAVVMILYVVLIVAGVFAGSL